MNRASRGFRLAAVMLDVAFYYALSVPGAIAEFVAATQMDGPRQWLEPVGYLGVVAYVIVQAILVTRTGQSLGKRLLGLRIVRTDGTRPGFVRGVLLRSWLLAVPFFVAAAAFEFLWPWSESTVHLDAFLVMLLPYAAQVIDAMFIVGGSRRCLHDFVAGTEVVHASAWRPR